MVASFCLWPRQVAFFFFLSLSLSLSLSQHTGIFFACFHGQPYVNEEIICLRLLNGSPVTRCADPCSAASPPSYLLTHPTHLPGASRGRCVTMASLDKLRQKGGRPIMGVYNQPVLISIRQHTAWLSLRGAAPPSRGTGPTPLPQ